MRKIFVAIAATAALATLVAPAAAASKPGVDVKAACLVGAITWDGKENPSAQQLIASGDSFAKLAKSKDRSFRAVIKPLIATPNSDSAARAFGRWCKSHFPKVATISLSSFSVPQYHTPVPADFTIELTVISKQCFGSAGCVITYTPKVTYNSLTSLDPSKSYTVVYEIAGGESPATANLTIQGTQVSYHNGTAETADDGAVLTATVTSVF